MIFTVYGISIHAPRTGSDRLNHQKPNNKRCIIVHDV